MGLPLVSWNPGGGTTSVLFKRGPRNFVPRWAGISTDNVATSGLARERVFQRADILIGFDMPAVIVDDDLTSWGAFMAWAIPGGGFKFYPNAALTDYYNCVDEGSVWEPRRVGAGVYGYSFLFRVLLDGQAPANPGVILRRLMGITP